MLSIFIMYSTDRAKALEYTLSCLREMPLYDESQRTLVVDGKVDAIPSDWEHVQVPRSDGKFCWGRMWDAGVCTARNEQIVYLDSDRLLPKNYLQLVAKKVKDDLFLYTSKHFMMTRELSVASCKKFLENRNPMALLGHDEFLGSAKYEPRYGDPVHEPSKNVMSGSTAFTKRTYMRLGGVDHWYCGHGAFADTDFHLQAATGGCEFLDLELPELHYPHNKLGVDSKALDNQSLYMMALDNFIYYCSKWGLPMALAEGLAHRSGVKRPSNYVDKKLKSIKAIAKGSAGTV